MRNMTSINHIIHKVFNVLLAASMQETTLVYHTYVSDYTRITKNKPKKTIERPRSVAYLGEPLRLGPPLV